jgi:hypothetical protein
MSLSEDLEVMMGDVEKPACDRDDELLETEIIGFRSMSNEHFRVGRVKEDDMGRLSDTYWKLRHGRSRDSLGMSMCNFTMTRNTFI